MRILNRTAHPERKLMKVHRCFATFAVLLGSLLGLPAVAQTGAGPGGKDVIVPELKGVVFVSKPGDINANGVSQTGVDVSGVPLLNADDFRSQVAAHLGKPLTFDDLNSITHAVVECFRAKNHPLVDAVAPQQNVQSGVVQILVTEFRVGNVTVQGNRWFSDRLVSAPISLRHGDVVDSRQLVNELDAANSNPFRQVNLVYKPGAEVGYTDVVLETHDRFPVRVFSGFDNSGTPVTGRSRWNIGATWGNALWHDQQISYQFSSSTNLFTGRSAQPGEPGGASFLGNLLTWSIPVFNRDSISLLGSYDRAIPNVGQDFGLIGRSAQASFRYTHALKRSGAFVHDLQFGYDFKLTNNNLDFGGAQISRNNAQIDQFSLGYGATRTDNHGSTTASTTIFYSPGNLTGGNTDAAFQPAVGQSGRSFASARYAYWRSDVTRLTRLPASMVWSFRVLGQTSNANLLYTEQLAGGGTEVLRGYNPNSILGDKGIILSNELRSPAFHKNGAPQFGQLQILGFWDYGYLNNVHDVPDELNHINASSAGAGVRYNLRANLTARFDYGWQLHHLPNSDGRGHLANVALIVAY
jgi:hemolysin activation/secretion protein